MQSEPGWPRIILYVYPRSPGEECAPDRDSFMRTGRLACLPEDFSFSCHRSALPALPHQARSILKERSISSASSRKACAILSSLTTERTSSDRVLASYQLYDPVITVVSSMTANLW